MTEKNDKGREGWKQTSGRKVPPNRIRGGVLLSVGVLGTLLLMSNAGQLPHGPLWGILTMLLATAGLFDLLGLLQLHDPDAVPIGKTVLAQLPGEPAWAAPKYGAAIAAVVLLGGGILLGYARLPWLIVLALLALVPAALRRPGLLVFVVAGGLYLPLLGAYGLWDPWETHYGEVAREILARDDWISLWWAHENWFWSKPILIFWSEALSMGVLGVDFRPDANPGHPEWALRLPIVLMSLGALLAVYAAVQRVFGKRAGVLSALVLATMPHFFFLSHQAITDMPFVANMTIAMGLLVLAVTEDPDRLVRTYRVGKVTLSARHAIIGAIFLVALPQALYLVSRNVTMVELFQFAWHEDQFLFGSAGNAGLPGHAAARDSLPYFSSVAAQPIVQGLVWIAGLTCILLLLRRERRAQSLFMFGFYLFCGLAFMGKGIPGFALPGMVALLFLVASRRWDLLLEGRLRIAAGALVVAVVGLPWYVAMHIRHGPPFFNRLFVHDHINRLASGVHGDTGSIEYFLEQLGYSTFPWVALVPGALTLWLWFRSKAGEESADDEARRRHDTLTLVAVWFAGAFTLFSAMITKFHHYIFPAVPPAAILVGILLSRAFGPTEARFSARRLGATLLAVLSPVPIVLGIGGFWGDIRGIIPEGLEGAEKQDWVMEQGMAAAPALLLVVLGVGLLAGAWWLLRPRRSSADGDETPRDRLGIPAPSYGAWEGPLAVLMIAGTALVAFVGRDLSWVTDARPQGYERLIHLFVYNYGRSWPEQFDYRPILTGFTLTAGLVLGLAALRFARPVATRALLGLALAFTVWSLDVYMVDLSPHWGQRELVKKYYEEREGPEEPIVAWQMNWKGENFYTGNRVLIFVDLDNEKIREWMGDNRGTTAYFVLEHSRLNNFRSLLPGRTVEPLTDERFNNKFVLVRAQL